MAISEGAERCRPWTERTTRSRRGTLERQPSLGFLGKQSRNQEGSGATSLLGRVTPESRMVGKRSVSRKDGEPVESALWELAMVW